MLLVGKYSLSLCQPLGKQEGFYSKNTNFTDIIHYEENNNFCHKLSFVFVIC